MPEKTTILDIACQLDVERNREVIEADELIGE